MPISAPQPVKKRKLAGMRLIRGGAFTMGSDDFYAEERPARPASVGDFWIDEVPVTNADFARFVEDTGYHTFAERPPRLVDYPGMDPSLARAGSSVFMAPDSSDAIAATPGTAPHWWSFVFEADWRHPLGPQSSLEGRWDHPVVHIVAEDAEAYATWAGKTLPTEAEWEFAARGGLESAPYAWGDVFEPDGRSMAKIWRGVFPQQTLDPPGEERTAPVRSYPPNGFGLFDMIGNVWEWTAEWFLTASAEPTNACCSVARERWAREASIDPKAAIRIPRRVLKGGSHLCAPNYCQRYRPAARWAQPIDTSTSHVGFRLIVRR